MKFGDIDSTVFGFGQSDDDEGGWCFIQMKGVLEYKICKATKGKGGGGRVDASEQNKDKIRVRSKKLYPLITGTCGSAEDHLVSECVCEKSEVEKNNGGNAMKVGKCDDQGWQTFTYRKKMSMGGFKGQDWQCGTTKTGTVFSPVKNCDGCISKKYDKEFDLTDVFQSLGNWSDAYSEEEGNPVLIQFTNTDARYNYCSWGGGGYNSWWCTSQAKTLFDYAVTDCDAQVSVDPAFNFIKIATLTPKVQDCLLKTLDCSGHPTVVKEALMSRFMSDLATGGDPEDPSIEPMFPRINCETGECDDAGGGPKPSHFGVITPGAPLIPPRAGCDDDVDEKFRCK